MSVSYAASDLSSRKFAVATQRIRFVRKMQWTANGARKRAFLT
jgi:hypothetical protein